MRYKEVVLSPEQIRDWECQMLAGAGIPGFLSPVVHERNGDVVLSYKTAGLRPLRNHLLNEHCRRTRLLLFRQVVRDCLQLEQEYFLPPEWPCLDIDEMYVDPRGNQMKLVCIPGNRTDPGTLAAVMLQGIWQEQDDQPYDFEGWLTYVEEQLQFQPPTVGPPSDGPEENANGPVRESCQRLGVMQWRSEDPFGDMRVVGLFYLGLFAAGVLFGIIS